MAVKCGSCHRKRMPNRKRPGADTSPVAAVQPINGGSAPGTAPTTTAHGERLFIGVQIQSNSTATDIAKSVVAGRLASGALTLQEITPDAAISGGGVDEIIVALGSLIELTPRHLRVLHASTGPDYLIVNGSQAALDSAGNKIRALPLVNDPDMPTIRLSLLF